MSILIKLFICASLLISVSCKERSSKSLDVAQMKDSRPQSNFTSKQLTEELSKITYPDLILTDVNFEESFAFAIQMGAEVHPNAPFRIPFYVSSDIQSEKKFTIKCDGLTFKQLMNRICDESGLVWKIDNGLVVVER